MKAYNSFLVTTCFGLWAVVTSSFALADCVEDPRRVELSKDNIVRVKSFLCREGQGSDEVQLKVEFHRFTENAASLLVGKGSSLLLKGALGSPKVIENEVFAIYADLLKRFGETEEYPAFIDITPVFGLSVPGDTKVENVDRIEGGRRTLKTIAGSGVKGGDMRSYPAIREIQTLMKKVVPSGMKFYYRADCLDEGIDSFGTKICQKYDKKRFVTTFWRGLRSQDFADYAQNIKAYNALVKETYKRKRKKLYDVDLDLFDEKRIEKDAKYFRLLNHLSNQDWPEDFFFLEGEYMITECGTESGQPVEPFGWDFGYTLRTIILDAALITNRSRQPIKIEKLLGHRSSGTNLRIAAISGVPESPADSLGDLLQVLGVGESILIPTQIMFSVPERFPRDTRNISNEIQRRVGTSGFPGNTKSYGVPTLKDYIYGPQLAIRGIVANGKSVDVGRRAANFVDLTYSIETGSCPYLLSWDAQSGTWLNHGKVLDKGSNKEREYTETKTFTGFKPRFRIEEREPEIAFIDQAELLVKLKNNETLVLKPDGASLGARDGRYVQLYWGDAIDVIFVLPDGVKDEDVVESRFSVAGYYERYSSLLTMEATPPRGGAIVPRSRRAEAIPSSLTNEGGIADNALMCPVPTAGGRSSK